MTVCPWCGNMFARRFIGFLGDKAYFRRQICWGPMFPDRSDEND